jgi:sigma-B regulation protein RsbU (phosphoserine phosphatase)
MFVTLFLGFLCIRTGVLTFANAGHLPPWRIASGSHPVQIPCKPGLPLGIMPASTYRDYLATLEPGDALVVITDGLPEMMDAAGAFYTMDRVVADIASVSHGTPIHIVTELAARVMDFAAGTSQADDVTALAVRIGPRPA